MTPLLVFAKAFFTGLFALFLLAGAAASATMEGEVGTFDIYNFENETDWGKATIEVRSPSLRYRLFSLYSEPVYALHLRYGISRVTLEHREGRKMTIDVDRSAISALGPQYTTFVRMENSNYLKVGTEIAKSLRMIDVDIYIPMHGASAAIFRRMPGIMGAPGSWSRDMPGSPSWNRLFVRPLTNIWSEVEELRDSDYLGTADAKTAWKRLVDVSVMQQVVQTFSISNAVFDVPAFLARITEVNPDALTDFFFNKSETQKQAEALVGAYVGAAEALRQENGMPADPEAIRRRRNLTVRSLNALKDAGLVGAETYYSMSRTFWDQAMSAFERRLVALGDEATAALEGSTDPASTAAPYRDRLASLRAEAEQRGALPGGLKDRFDRLASLLDVDCSKFVTASCEPLLEFAPDDGATFDGPVVDVTGRVKPDYVSALNGRLALLVGEQDQRVELRSDGTFSTKAVLASGENSVSLQLADPAAGAQAGVVLARRTIVYTGRPTRLRVTLTWDTSGSDIDLHVTSPACAEVDFNNKIAGSLRLDVDNTEGYGPENISTEQAESGIYRISVVNYARGNGTTATVHVYRNEKLETRESHKFYDSGEEWYVGGVLFD